MRQGFCDKVPQPEWLNHRSTLSQNSEGLESEVNVLTWLVPSEYYLGKSRTHLSLRLIYQNLGGSFTSQAAQGKESKLALQEMQGIWV